MVNKSIWLALAIGNSRLHWALFKGEELCGSWDTDYLTATSIQLLASGSWDKFHSKIEDFAYPLPLYLVSVVPSQTKLWQIYPNIQIITLNDVPLENMYSTLGSDRALALWGAKETYSLPALVIDSGTALTFTGSDANFAFVGGAILPGLSLQFQALSQKTANLSLIQLPTQLPPYFATNTTQSIQSGIIYTLIAGIKSFIEKWLQMYPNSQVILTGGDRTILYSYLYSQFPDLAEKIKCDRNLIFWGIQAYRKAQNLS